jgi:hypothetical protein
MVESGALLAARSAADVRALLDTNATGTGAANALFGVASPALDYARLLAGVTPP